MELVMHSGDVGVIAGQVPERGEPPRHAIELQVEGLGHATSPLGEVPTARALQFAAAGSSSVAGGGR